jgi:hypothetical protein
MKTVLLSLKITCISLFFVQMASAKVWRVNNNTGVHADFTQVTTAVSSPLVQEGDTIYIEPSPTQYTGATPQKRLVFIGAGYFLSENTGLQYNTNDSRITSFTIDSLASGSSFFGIRSNLVFVSSNADNITFSRCHISFATSVSFANSLMSNWIINKCYVLQFAFNNAAYVFENLQFTNSIVFQSFNLANCINGLVRNNILLGGVTMNNTYATNNIFATASSLNFTNCTVKYNISTSNNLPAGNNNQVSVPQASLFILTGSTDARYQLAAGSPAIGAGEPINGETPDCGPFGTADPYRLSGIPAIPAIYELQVPPSIPSSATTMQVTISTRSNN